MKLKTKLIAGASTLVMATGMIGIAAPEAAHAAITPQGGCGGAVQLVKLTTPTKGVGLTDQTQNGVKAAGNLAADQVTKVKIGGACEGPGGPQPHLKVRTGDPHVPQPTTALTAKSEAVSLLGNASCATGKDAVAADATAANAWPLNGKITWTFNETYTDILTLGVKPYKMQADVALLGFDPAGLDIVDVGGIVLTGTEVGATVGGQIWEDPVSKTGGATGYNTGYELDTANALGCATAAANDANITQVLTGGGNVAGHDSSNSLLGSTGVQGVTFQFGELAPTITSVTPNTGTHLGGTSVTIHGTDLIHANKVMFGAANAAVFTVVNDTTITVTSPAKDPLDPATVDVTVSIPTGTSALVAADQYTYS